MKVKPEMERLAERLRTIYPDKYIDIEISCRYHPGTDAPKFVYSLYVADTIIHETFNSLTGMEAYISAVLTDKIGDPEETDDKEVE